MQGRQGPTASQPCPPAPGTSTLQSLLWSSLEFKVCRENEAGKLAPRQLPANKRGAKLMHKLRCVRLCAPAVQRGFGSAGLRAYIEFRSGNSGGRKPFWLGQKRITCCCQSTGAKCHYSSWLDRCKILLLQDFSARHNPLKHI